MMSSKNTSSMKKFRTAKKGLFYLTLFNAISACDAQNSTETLYFGAREIGPSISIYSSSATADIKKLTDDEKWRDIDLDVAKNGDLVFSSNRKDNFAIDMRKQSEQYHVFLQTADASKPTQISNSSSRDLAPRFSPDGSTVAFIRKSKPKESLMLFDRDTQKTQALLSAESINGHSWAPDGQQLAVTYATSSQSHLTIFKLKEKKSITPLTFFIDKPNGATEFTPNAKDPFLKTVEAPEWSPNGEYIAFILNPLYQDGVRQLKLYSSNNHSVKSISDDNIQVQSPTRWSKDSGKILYSALVGYKFYFNEETQKKVYEGAMHAFLADLSNGNQQLTTGQHMFRNPTFSPDQKSIAYYYAENLGARQYQLKIMRMNDNKEKTLYEKVAQNSTLHWQASP